MTLRADIFAKLRTPKNVAREMSKKSRLRGPFEGTHDKQGKALLHSKQQHSTFTNSIDYSEVI